ncbi:hypothetical protein M902_0734 [Bacteriovorax sp. BAL6_X]|uniref:hypothetical protein n=1 Tax=Bacteriovorax sp. BAL6_X TaxID=1201290 RepID=UPI00038645BC|nr:hypothetical protein [Bacteriovorax sp. BAL6_X]EPZ49644.1 hypothetical protein M902_0734 [Bacteriovorax sp. BAL6_X]
MKIKSFFIVTLFFMSFVSFANSELDKVKEAMIRQSIMQYSGNCPCPYNTMRNGRRCGERSAYSRPGGASPLCYKSDIPDSTAKQFINKLK